MTTSFAALLFRPDAVPDRALAQGFAVALAGWDAPAPRLLVGPLPGIPGWSAAFYSSGARLPRGAEDEEIDHAAELFEDALPPAVAVLDAAAELGRGGGASCVYAIVFAEDPLLDDAWRFDDEGAVRHFVREGDDGPEAGVATADDAQCAPIAASPAGASEADAARALEAAIRPHRGSTLLSRELGAPALPALMGALFTADRRVDVRLVAPGQDAIAAETRRLVRALGRVEGRGASELPAEVAGVATPDAYRAFAAAYDWADPKDPADLYRGLAIGAIEGTLCFLRPGDLRALDADPAWSAAASAGVFPLATLTGSALGSAAAAKGTLGLQDNLEDLVIVPAPPRGATRATAGPTLGELLRYLALGWSKRSDAEEDMIQALMLRAKVRTSHAMK